MLTEDIHQSLIDTLVGEGFFTPATVEELSEEDMTFNSPIAIGTDDYSMFHNLSDNKPTAYSVTNMESHDSVSSPTDSAQSPDLLDLESVNSWSTWNPSLTDLADPEWLPLSHTANQQTLFISNNTTTSKSKKQVKSSTPAKATKRRNSSLTSELELQIEIEESTKRAKRCTVPLTEEQKRLRRKELNRLAAQRCRSKRKSHADVLEDEIDELTLKNRELKEKLEKLESTKAELYDVIKFHFANCPRN